MLIDEKRASLAAALYNNVHAMLTEHGWVEDMEEDHFWPRGKPTGSWRHPNHLHSHSMDAAFVVLARTMLPKRT
jgi:hypothetical protein